MTIYIQKGFTQNKMVPMPSAGDDFTTLAEMVKQPKTIQADTQEAIEDYKKEQLTYFLAGKLAHNQRSNANYQGQSLVLVDFDDIPDEPAFVASLAKLDKFAYILWPSISYGFKGARYHLALKPSRDIAKGEKAATIQAVNRMLGIESDEHMKTWAQMFGAPVVNTKSAGKTRVHPDGQVLDVDQAVGDYKPQEAKAVKRANSQSSQTESSHGASYPDEYIHDLLLEFAEEHKEELVDEQAFSSYMINLVSYYQYGSISLSALQDAVNLLATGNKQWQVDNQAKLQQHLTKSYDANVVPLSVMFHTDVPVHEYADEHKQYTSAGIKRNLVQTAKDMLKFKQQNNVKAKLSIDDVATIMLASVPMWLDRELENGPIFMYDADQGIYTASRRMFAAFVVLADSEADTREINNVYDRLTTNGWVRAGKAINDRNLIAANNGVVDLTGCGKDKNGDWTLPVIKPFSPAYHFVAKIATDYRPKAWMSEPVIKHGDKPWKPSEWLKQLANDDKQVYTLLLQVIGDACQSSYSRRQAVWLVGNPNNTRGNGANGKSTFEALAEAIVGSSNAAHLKIDQFGERFALNELMGKSLVIGDDVQAGKFIKDQSAFNSAVTGDVLRADIKNRQPINFTFSGTIIQSTNGMPRFANQSEGTNRRMLIVPFMAQFNIKQANDAVKTDYVKRAEVREYLLSLAILTICKQPTFKQPRVSQKLLDEFATGNDQVATFMEETDWTSEVIPVQWAYDKFKAAMADAGFNSPKSRPQFVKDLVEYGYVKAKKHVSQDNFNEVPAGSTDFSQDEYMGKYTSCLVKQSA